MSKTYYEVLGVKPDADFNTVRSAYRKLIKQYPPDLTLGSKEVEIKFKEIDAAWEQFKAIHNAAKEKEEQAQEARQRHEREEREKAAEKERQEEAARKKEEEARNKKLDAVKDPMLRARVKEFMDIYEPLTKAAVNGIKAADIRVYDKVNKYLISKDIASLFFEQRFGAINKVDRYYASSEDMQDININAFSKRMIKEMTPQGKKAILENQNDRAETIAAGIAALEEIAEGWSKNKYYETLLSDLKECLEKQHAEEQRLATEEAARQKAREEELARQAEANAERRFAEMVAKRKNLQRRVGLE